MINGMINIYKERGFTSHDVVAKMRGICGQKKIGHTGTLDPYATGVLPVCLGSGTKLCEMLTDHDKEYVAELLLGESTDTQDVTGTVIQTGEVNCTEEEVAACIQSFVGEYMQVPPMYSALKVNGKKLYELAREGKEVEREARQVWIHEIEILQIALPVVKFRVVCSKGTYIRTLCNDIGEKLGCFGTMQSLERSRVGQFSLANAVTLETLQRLKEENNLDSVVTTVEDFFRDLSSVYVKAEDKKFPENGNSFMEKNIDHIDLNGKENAKQGNVRVYCDGRFYGLYEYSHKHKCYVPVKMFLEPSK